MGLIASSALAIVFFFVCFVDQKHALIKASLIGLAHYLFNFIFVKYEHPPRYTKLNRYSFNRNERGTLRGCKKIALQLAVICGTACTLYIILYELIVNPVSDASKVVVFRVISNNGLIILSKVAEATFLTMNISTIVKILVRLITYYTILCTSELK